MTKKYIQHFIIINKRLNVYQAGCRQKGEPLNNTWSALMVISRKTENSGRKAIFCIQLKILRF